MRSKKDRLMAFLMLLPSLILIGIFVYFFIAKAIYISTTDWGEDPAKPPLTEGVEKDYIALQNYQNLMTDVVQTNFRVSLINTFFFTIFFVLGCVVIGLTLAILLDQKQLWGEAIFRTIFLFPMSLSFVVTGTIWRWMLQPNGGINLLPRLVGADPIEFNWLSSQSVWFQFQWQDIPTYLTYIGFAVMAILLQRYASRQQWRSVGFVLGIMLMLGLIWANRLWDYLWLPLDSTQAEQVIAPKGFNTALLGILLAAIWQMSGYTMAIFIAGIRGVSNDLREAARIDGAGEWGMYWYVILPQLNNIFISAIIILGHISLKIFDLVFAMTGPDNARTVVPGMLVYTKGFRQNSFASGAAIAIVMLILVATLIIPYLWLQLRPRKR